MISLRSVLMRPMPTWIVGWRKGTKGTITK